jgi:hypothetical protein
MTFSRIYQILFVSFLLSECQKFFEKPHKWVLKLANWQYLEFCDSSLSRHSYFCELRLQPLESIIVSKILTLTFDFVKFNFIPSESCAQSGDVTERKFSLRLLWYFLQMKPHFKWYKNADASRSSYSVLRISSCVLLVYIPPKQAESYHSLKTV